MSNEPRYAIVRNTIISVCMLLMGVAVFRSCEKTIGPMLNRQTANNGQAPPPAPAGYVQRFCTDIETRDYSDKNPDSIGVQPKDGCFGIRVKIPAAWANYFVQKSQDKTDWISIWCNGHPLPSQPFPYYQNIPSMTSCRDANEKGADFYIEGRGTISFRRTQTAADYHPTVDIEKLEASHKLTPIEPKAGQPEAYLITIQQCYRSEEAVRCWGNAVNKTDAPVALLLRDSTAVDDIGHSFTLPIIGILRPPGLWWESSRDFKEKLLPSLRYKFNIVVPDAHEKATTLTLDFNVLLNGENPRRDELVFQEVPIQ
jgi:hypothetical protein